MSLNGSIRKAFKEAFENNCILLTLNAYKISVKEKLYDLTWTENDFSELLRHYINSSQLSKDLGIICISENKLLNNSVKLEKGFADKLPRIDFKFTTFSNRNTFDFYLEAKRLKEKDSKLKRAYIDDGMDRFISKKYPKGYMLGYLLNGDIFKTIEGINKLLMKDSRTSEVLLKKQFFSHLGCFESNHVPVGKLRHIILKYSN